VGLLSTASRQFYGRKIGQPGLKWVWVAVFLTHLHEGDDEQCVLCTPTHRARRVGAREKAFLGQFF